MINDFVDTRLVLNIVMIAAVISTVTATHRLQYPIMLKKISNIFIAKTKIVFSVAISRILLLSKNSEGTVEMCSGSVKASASPISAPTLISISAVLLLCRSEGRIATFFKLLEVQISLMTSVFSSA